MSTDPKTPPPPVAIGGIGGSGTRLIAAILAQLGYYLGDDINESNDTLWFTLLFKRLEILYTSTPHMVELLTLFTSRLTGPWQPTPAQCTLIQNLASIDRPQHPAWWLQLRATSFLTPRNPALLPPDTTWGWKEPNTHIILPQLIKLIPGLKYIHVMRNGLDMAYSSNQNQLLLWGSTFLGTHCPITPGYSLKYWHYSHHRLLDNSQPLGEERFLLLNYDEFCHHPTIGLVTLLKFLAVPHTPQLLDSLLPLIRPPASLGRFRNHGLQAFDPQDVRFVKHLGFPIH